MKRILALVVAATLSLLLVACGDDEVAVVLDDTDGSGYRVTSLVVELPDGPETFEVEAS